MIVRAHLGLELGVEQACAKLIAMNSEPRANQSTARLLYAVSELARVSVAAATVLLM